MLYQLGTMTGIVVVGDLLGISEEQISAVWESMAQMAMPLLIAMIVVGMTVCFFGLKLVRALSAIAGLAVGAGVGIGVVLGFGFSENMISVVILSCAVLMAVLFGVVYRLGVFLVALLYTAVFMDILLMPYLLPAAALGVSAAAAVLLAVLGVIKPEPVTIVITGISGGMGAWTAAVYLFGINGNMWMEYGIGAALSVIGIWIQLMMQSRKLKRKEEGYAKQIKDQVSRESEVERARRILEEEGDEDEDDGEEEIEIISEDL